MNLDDLKPGWQSEDLSGPRFDEIAASVKQKGAKFESDIFKRDMTEAAAAVFVFVAAAPAMLFGPNMMFRFGFLLMMLGTIEVVIVMTLARRKDRLLSADLSLREYCQIELRRIDRQIWLLEHVLWWYIGPLFLGAPFVILGVPSPIFSKVIVGVLFLIVGWAVYLLNQQGARVQLRPLRDSIASVLAQCDTNPEPPEIDLSPEVIERP